jgi:hypothetical protein
MLSLMGPEHDDSIDLDELVRMEHWAAWVSQLLHNAADAAEDARDRRMLAGAAEDADSLRRALGAAVGGWLDPGQTAIVRSIYELWDANLATQERLAAAADPEGHRRWSTRSAPARRQLFGDDAPRDASYAG